MSVRVKLEGEPDSRVIFIMSDPGGTYTASQVAALLEQAEALGFPLEFGTWMSVLTVGQLDALINFPERADA